MSHLFTEGARMKRMISSVAVIVAAVLSVGTAAQSSGTAGPMGKMEMKDTTHTGCIETGSAQGTFTLTHLAADDQMGKDAMKMAKTSSKDALEPALTLTSSSVDLSKHLGHKVSVIISPPGAAPSTLVVKSLKMIAASCS
jgi:hypothetical protein